MILACLGMLTSLGCKHDPLALLLLLSVSLVIFIATLNLNLGMMHLFFACYSFNVDIDTTLDSFFLM